MCVSAFESLQDWIIVERGVVDKLHEQQVN